MLLDGFNFSTMVNISRLHTSFVLKSHSLSRSLYDKLKAALQKSVRDHNRPVHMQLKNANGKCYEQDLQQIAHAYTMVNRFLTAFIDHVRLSQ